MKFINKNEPTQVRIQEGVDNSGQGKFRWRCVKTGETIELDEKVGVRYGFTREVTKGKIGNTPVETKQLSVPQKAVQNTPDDLFMKELIAIKGIGKYTAEDIVTWGTKEKLIENIQQNKKLPFRDDISQKLEGKYGKN